MLEIECICCGSDLPERHIHPRPLLHSMCGHCTDEVKRMHRELHGVNRERASGMIQCRTQFQQSHSS